MNDNWPWPTTDSMSKKTWSARVLEDLDHPGECILEFPEDIIDRVGWAEGDTLQWDLRDDGSVTISKI